jgi:hypothetical protein
MKTFKKIGLTYNVPATRQVGEYQLFIEELFFEKKEKVIIIN